VKLKTIKVAKRHKCTSWQRNSMLESRMRRPGLRVQLK